MEPAAPSGEISPLTEDADILTVVDDFESIYDVPFVTVNRVGDQIQAEILLSGIEEVDHDRISTAMSVAGERGFRAYARVFGTYRNVVIYFSDHPAKGTIWGLESELGNAWLQ